MLAVLVLLVSAWEACTNELLIARELALTFAGQLPVPPVVADLPAELQVRASIVTCARVHQVSIVDRVNE